MNILERRSLQLGRKDQNDYYKYPIDGEDSIDRYIRYKYEIRKSIEEKERNKEEEKEYNKKIEKIGEDGAAAIMDQLNKLCRNN